MTARTVLNETSNDIATQHYLFFFKEENKYSVANRKFVVCEDHELIIGNQLKVRDNGKHFIGTLINIGQKHMLEKLLHLQSNAEAPSEKPKSKTKKGPAIDVDNYSEGDDNSETEQPPKKVRKKKLKFGASQLESDPEMEFIEEEEEKEKSLLYKRVKTLETQFIEISKYVKVLQKKVNYLEDINQRCRTPPSNTKSETKNQSPADLEISQPRVVKEEDKEDKVILFNGDNLMSVAAPPKEPNKCAMKLLDRLFTRDELADGVLFASRKSDKDPLDAERVTLMFDVLKHKYSAERVQKMHQMIVDSCNQKCRDAARKRKNNQNKL